MTAFDFRARSARAHGKTLFTGALAAFVSLLYFYPTQSAQACGGFFCDAITLSPVYQAGERVVFDRRDDTTTMHVEISYEGDSSGFGWLLPMDKALVDEEGNIRPLEDILQISTRSLFDNLQNATNPIYRVNNSFDAECDDFGMFGGTAAPSVDSGARENDSGVEVLQSANIGPYGAEIIEAQSADDLYKWLEEQGYLQDPKAKEMLEHYVSKDFVFLGLRLLSDKDAGDIRPVQLNLGDTDAFVPLRLTAIAATTDMPMLVWVLGDHRAVPKNFMHAVVNPKALDWPGASNYVDVVTEAVDSVVGRAFVTEYAGSTEMMANSFYPTWVQQRQENLAEAKTLEEIADLLDNLNVRGDGEIRSILQGFISMPEGLTGYPYNDCCFDGSCWSTGDFACEENEDHLTTAEEFFGYLSWWLTELDPTEFPIDGDVQGIIDEMDYSYFDPRERIQEMFNASPYMTRFFTTISDDEMMRDPMFAQNPDLPEVPLTNAIETVVHFDEDCYEAWVEVTYPDGTMTVLSCDDTNCFGMPSIPALPDVDPLLWVEVMDETGQARPFDPRDAEEVDQLLDKSVPGSPTLPEWYDLQAPEDTTVNANTDLPDLPQNPETPGPQPTGGLCSAGTNQNAFNMFWIVALAIVGMQRTRRRQTEI
jgi:hypothetical protein